jgi:hypothetical protein
MIEQLRDLVRTTYKQLTYLHLSCAAAIHPRASPSQPLNYDRSIEQAAEHLGIPVRAEPPEKPDPRFFQSEGVRLLKLHGSIDWAWDDTDGERGTMTQHRVRRVEAGDTSSGRPALVFGSRAKLQAEGPFLALLAQFEEALSWSRRVIVVGYSFRDPHINEMIRRWTMESGEIIIVDPSIADDRPDDSFRGELVRALNPSRRQSSDALPERVRAQVKSREVV